MSNSFCVRLFWIQLAFWTLHELVYVLMFADIDKVGDVFLYSTVVRQENGQEDERPKTHLASKVRWTICNAVHLKGHRKNKLADQW